MKKKTGEFATVRWILSVIKGNKRYVLLLALTQMVTGVASTGYALFLSGLIDNAVAGNQSGFLRYCVLLICLVATMFLLKAFLRFLDEHCRTRVENAFKTRLFRNLLYKDYAQATAYHTGEWITRMTSDTVVVTSGVISIVPGLSATVVRLVCAVCLLYYYVPDLTVWVVLGGIGIMALTFVLRKSLKKLHKRVQMEDSRLRVFLTERLGSMMIIRAFEKEETALAQAKKQMGEHRKARMKKNRCMNMLHNGFGLVVNIVYITGAIVCGRGILAGTMTYGSFTAVLQLVSQVQTPIANASGYFTQYSSMIASAERIFELENYKEYACDDCPEDVSAYYRDRFHSIGLRNVGFTYLPIGEVEAGEEPRRTVLKGLDMEIHKGEYVAFCGPSGCGKSTVLKLLMCIYDLDEGERFLSDGEGEVPLTRSWRGLFSYVPQGNHLMSGTIREVVTFGEEADMEREEEIWQALKISCADSFVQELPDGLDTRLGERGSGLSEGQMQRIAIARAVFSDRPVLLLDEATSALDEDTEAKLLDNLRAMTDKTVIIVTHRPAALDITDKIIRFDPTEE